MCWPAANAESSLHAPCTTISMQQLGWVWRALSPERLQLGGERVNSKQDARQSCGHAGVPVCIFCGPSLAQLPVCPKHWPIQLHQGFLDDWLVPACERHILQAVPTPNQAVTVSARAAERRPRDHATICKNRPTLLLCARLKVSKGCGADSTGGFSLAAAALDAHHVNERVAAHSPVSAGPV